MIKLMLCYRLATRQQKIVKWTSVATILGYVGVIVVIWSHCTPVQRNWQVVPYPGGTSTWCLTSSHVRHLTLHSDECTLAVANYLSLVVLNISYVQEYSLQDGR